MTVEDKVRTIVELTEAEAEAVALPTVIQTIHRTRDLMESEVGDGVSQSVAARVLGTSPNTLNKWVARGAISKVHLSGRKREQVSRAQTVRLAVELRRLRSLGEPGLLAAAIQRLERDDPEYQREFGELYGSSLKAMRKGDLVPAGIPENFQPGD